MFVLYLYCKLLVWLSNVGRCHQPTDFYMHVRPLGRHCHASVYFFAIHRQSRECPFKVFSMRDWNSIMYVPVYRHNPLTVARAARDGQTTAALPLASLLSIRTCWLGDSATWFRYLNEQGGNETIIYTACMGGEVGGGRAPPKRPLARWVKALKKRERFQEGEKRWNCSRDERP